MEVKLLKLATVHDCSDHFKAAAIWVSVLLHPLWLAPVSIVLLGRQGSKLWVEPTILQPHEWHSTTTDWQSGVKDFCDKNRKLLRTTVDSGGCNVGSFLSAGQHFLMKKMSRETEQILFFFSTAEWLWTEIRIRIRIFGLPKSKFYKIPKFGGGVQTKIRFKKNKKNKKTLNLTYGNQKKG